MSEHAVEAAVSSRWVQALWRRKVEAAVGALILLAVAVVGSRELVARGRAADLGPTFMAKRGPLTISVTESGTISSRDKVIVKNELEGRTTIISIVPEGTHVKSGDLLVELDASKLGEDKIQQQILVLNADAAFIYARENLAVVKSQAESDVAKAALDLKFAEIDLKKYVQGEYPQELRQAEAEITLAKEELKRSQDKLDWSGKLAADGYVTQLELAADQLAFKRDQLDLQLAEGKLEVLEKYEHERDYEEAKSKLEQATLAVERAKRKAAADVAQADAGHRAKEAEFERQRSRLEKINDQIAKSKIKAPSDGLVVYASTGHRWGNDEPLREGREVYERQELIHLPTTSSMMAEVKIHESSLRKVQIGLPVRITVDALPGRVFSGTVGKIAVLPDATSVWLNPDLKVYNTELYLNGDGANLRPGMSSRAEIIVQELAEALYVPVQAVVRVGGNPVVYVAGSSSPEMREVTVGLDNNQMIHVTGGLAEGERVLLAPPLAPSALSGEQIPAADSQPGPGSATGQRAGTASRPALADDSAETRDPQKGSEGQRRRRPESLSPDQREAPTSQRADQERLGSSGNGRPSPASQTSRAQQP